jgi:hypothetical protein
MLVKNASPCYSCTPTLLCESPVLHSALFCTLYEVLLFSFIFSENNMKIELEIDAKQRYAFYGKRIFFQKCISESLKKTIYSLIIIA